MKCSMSNLTSMYGSLVQVTELNDELAWKDFHPFPLCYIISYLCPDEFRLIHSNCSVIPIPLDDINPQLISSSELSFKTLHGMGKQVSKQRRRKVVEGMWQQVEKQFKAAHSSDYNFDSKLLARIKKEGWVPFGAVPTPTLPAYLGYIQPPSPNNSQPNGPNSPIATAQAAIPTGCGHAECEVPVLSSNTNTTNMSGSSTDSHSSPVTACHIPPSCPFHSLLTDIHAHPMYRSQVTHVHTLPATPCRRRALQPPLPADLLARLGRMMGRPTEDASANVSSKCLDTGDKLDCVNNEVNSEESSSYSGFFYTHQVEGMKAIREGRHLTLTSPPSSGKTLTYLLPILEAFQKESCSAPGSASSSTSGGSIALLLFPTKALTQDQFRSIHNFLYPLNDASASPSLSPITYAHPVILDGDTLWGDRREIQGGSAGNTGRGNLVLTNPDMLHCTIMPEHKAWKRIFAGLRFVVIDEAHTYRGIFGTHISLVLRRLIRLTLRYRSHSSVSRPRTNIPQFVLLSGTVINPLQMMAGLLPLLGLYRGLSDEKQSCGKQTDADPLSNLSHILSHEHLYGREARQHVEDYFHARIVDSQYDGAPRGERVVVFWNPPLKHGGDIAHNIGDDEGNDGVGSSSDEARWMHEADKHMLPIPPHRTQAVASDTAASLLIPDRLSSIYEISQLLEILLQKRVRTLAFCGVRKCVELVYKYTSNLLTQHKQESLIPLLGSYRGGYSKEERRDIEQQLFSEQLLAVATTSALELGIDIGSMECTLHLGMPATGSAFVQQMGRAGRKTQPSLHIVVAFNSPIDQYYINNPGKLFANKQLAGERVVVNVDNVYTLRHHVILAAKEVPLNVPLVCWQDGKSWTVHDSDLWGDEYEDTVEFLVITHKLHMMKEADVQNFIRNSGGNVAEGSVQSIKDFFPVDNKQNRPKSKYRANLFCSAIMDAEKVSLRQIDPVAFAVVVEGTGDVLDSIGYSRAFYELFEQAIYMHRGKQYMVVKLDLINYIARVKQVNVKHYTSASDRTALNIVKVLQLDEDDNDGMFNYGILQVVQTVFGYSKHSLYSHFVFERGECQLPPLEYETQAFWIFIPASIKMKLEAMGHNVTIAAHSANHAIVALLPSLLACDAGDICTEHVDSSTHASYNRLLIYDKPMGGIGLAKSLYVQHKVEILQDARDMLAKCECTTDGCPVCVYDHRCQKHNSDCSKVGAIALLELLIDCCTTSCKLPSDNNIVSPRKRSGMDIADDITAERENGRRQQRKISQQYATLRDSGASIQKNWTSLLPNFVTDS